LALALGALLCVALSTCSRTLQQSERKRWCIRRVIRRGCQRVCAHIRVKHRLRSTKSPVPIMGVVVVVVVVVVGSGSQCG
jgi:hypothetical protein